ncbi:MAG: tetratricopeptide repeat protein [Elusimicrobia bacterium]|nr:tetratricopeptide repeat protein [Elusimicrobiota bacterium]
MSSFLFSQSVKEETLELSWQSFIYSKKLENAYNLSKKALTLYPKNITWSERMAQVCIWTGRTEEAAQIYEKMSLIGIYPSTLKENLKIFKNTNPFFYAKATEYFLKKEFSEKSFEDLFLFYSSLGEKEKAYLLSQAYLDKIKDKKTKEELALFYLDNGYGSKAEHIISSALKDSCAVRLKYAKLKFSSKKFDKALDILKKYTEQCSNIPEYYFFLSDLSFLLSKYEEAAKASQKLLSLGNYREIDAERVFNFYMIKDKKKASETSLAAYKKFNKKYFLYYYLSSLDTIEEKLYFLNRESLIEKDIIAYYNLQNYNNLSYSQRKSMLKKILSIKDWNLLSDYFWLTYQNATHDERVAVSNKFSCFSSESSNYALPLAYLKSSHGDYSQALYCFEKYYLKNAPSSLLWLSYSDFLRNAGLESEADFFIRKAYSAKEDGQLKNSDGMRLKLIFENSSFFKKNLRESDLSVKEKLELKLSYLELKDLKEAADDITIKKSQDSPQWALFSYIVRNGGDQSRFLKSSYSPPLRDLASLLISEGKINEGKDKINEALTKAQDNPKNHLYWKSLFLKKSFENSIYSEYQEKNYAYYKKIGFNSNIYSYDTVKINGTAESENINFYPGKGFVKNTKDNMTFSLAIEEKDWSLDISLFKKIENILSFSAEKRFLYKNASFLLSARHNVPSSESVILENTSKKDVFLQDFSNSLGKKLKLGFVNSFSNYKDQKGMFLGKGKENEIYILLPHYNTKVYGKIGNFSSDKWSQNYSINKIYSYYNFRILPENFSETGISLSLFDKKGLSYSSRWESPIFLSLSYNSQTLLNYSAFLNIKTPGFNKKDSVISLSYSEGGATNSDSVFSCRLIFNFR